MIPKTFQLSVKCTSILTPARILPTVERPTRLAREREIAIRQRGRDRSKGVGMPRHVMPGPGDES